MTNSTAITLEQELAELEKKHGFAMWEGSKYILTQDAYIDGPADDHDACRYLANAIRADAQPDEDGCVDCYELSWSIPDATWEYWADGNDDEGDACDWENPDDLTACCGYNISERRCV